MIIRTLFRTLTKTKRRNNPNPIRSISTTSPIHEDVPIEKVDCVVVGAGVVGLAIARELSMKHGREVLVIESAPTFGSATSSRNSEVIHAGIYYPPSSLKARFCVRGRELLCKYCTDREIPHKQIGKLIIATGASDIKKLQDLMKRGTENGVPGLRLMEGHEAMRLEPELQCTKALLSPVSGIIDTHTLMLSLVGDAESHGTTFSCNTTVIGGHCGGNQIQLHISGSNSLESQTRQLALQPELILMPQVVVNAAGLAAPILARRLCLPKETVPTPYYARGCYFSLSSTQTPLFNHLIYPIPEDGGLGIHVTLDLNGQVKFGPDVEWIEGVDDFSSFLNRFDYSVSGDREKEFYPAIRKYFPNLKDGSLEPSYSGIRPKLSGPKQISADFLIQGQDIHGVAGLVNLFGIESPGLTASMAIAEHVAARLIG